MKKFFTYLFILTVFFFSTLSRPSALDSCSPLSSATLYDIYGYNSLSPLSTTTREGTICSNAYIGYGDLGPSGSLGYLANLSNLYSKDTYYTVSFYLFSTTNASLTTTNFNDGYLAISTGNSANAWASSNFGVSDVTSSVNYYSYEGGGLVYSVFTYIFKANTNFDSIFVPFSSSTVVYGADFQLYGVSITNTGRDTLSSIEVNSLLTSQTEDIKNTIDNLQTNIDNTIKDTFEDCRPSKNLFNYIDSTNYYINSTGNLISSTTDLLSQVIEVKPSSNITISSNETLHNIVIYEFNYNTYLKQTKYNTTNLLTITLSENTNNIRVSFNYNNSDFTVETLKRLQVQIEEGSVATSYEEYGEVCQNIIDDTNDKLDNIQDSITSETPPNLGGLSGSAGWLPAGPVDSILNLPLTMLNSLLNNLGNSCTPLELPLPYVNSTLTLPCLNSIYSQIEGLNAWINTISVIASAFILYSYLLKLYKWVDDTLTFRENNHCDWGGV